MTAILESPLTEAASHLDVIREQQDHAVTVLAELLPLLPVPPSSFGVNQYSDGFNGRYGVELVLAVAMDDLAPLLGLIGGHILVEAQTTYTGAPCFKQTLTGTRAGVPIAAWTTVYPSITASAA